ncbi:MAG: SprT family zinc-dependent metalloprotease [Pseudomonadota bacterium]
MKREIRESCLEVRLAGEVLACRLRRSARRRSLALRVSESGEVVVNAPLRMPEGVIMGFVGKHLDWIRGRQQEAASHAAGWGDGMQLPYLGGMLTLRLLPAARAGVARVGDELHCHAAPAQAEAAVQRWYQRGARELLAARLAHHAARAGRDTPPLRLSGARTRWGSLSPKGVVSLNWRLVKAGLEEIDYVICHELAHFRQRNHSPAFWREVETLFPAWATARRRLRENARVYFQF